MKIGILSIIAECNSFLPVPTTLETFQKDRFLIGEDIRKAFGTGHHEVTGFFQGMQAAGHETVPLVMFSAGATGVITSQAMDQLWGLVADQIRKLGPFDAILAGPHGAAVGDGARHDMEAWWLGELRKLVGPKVPIVATIDPHCNLSPAKVAPCNAITAYRENPHIDQRQRGLEAAHLLQRMLAGEIKPTMRAAFPPVQINIEAQGTREEPMLSLIREVEKVRAMPKVLSASVVLGYPYSDVPEMGSAFIVVTDDDPKLAESLANGLGDWLVKNRERYRGNLISPEAAVQKCLSAKKPVGLLDMGDNMGGGAPADSTVLAHLFHQRKDQRVFVCLTDPEGVALAQKAGVGGHLRLKMGGHSPVSPAAPLEADVVVKGLYDGKYSEPEARHGGVTHFDMGPTTVVTTQTGLTVMLTPRRAFPGSLKQMTSCGLKPEDFDVIILKAVHSATAAYAPVCGTLIRANTPGITTADMVTLPYHHRRKPLFPFEKDV